jgi:hypothetical protein
VASGLYVKLTQPVIAGNGPRRALLYVARSQSAGQPRPGYLEGIVTAAQEAGLPADYVREIAAWSPGEGTRPGPAPARPPVRPLWSSPLSRDGK